MNTLHKNSQLGMLLLVFALAGCGGDVEPTEEPQGMEEDIKESALEEGSTSLQSTAPLDPFDVYLVEFHAMKEEPTQQVEAHLYCNEVNDEFAQCSVFDGNTEDANLNGIEYIISERLFESLPEEEKQYWHPHNYEILSGQLVAPGLAEQASEELMKSKMNSYGKSWHVWDTGTLNNTGDDHPLGAPQLAWSLNRDGEAIPGMVEQRDTTLEIDTRQIREQRQDLLNLANPQEGVNTLQGKFPNATSSIPGVVDKSEQDSIEGDSIEAKNPDSD